MRRRKLTPRAARKRQPKLADLKVTMEAKEVFALAFEGAGGLKRLIDYMKVSNTNYGMVIAHYAKLIPMSVSSQIDATVTVEDGQAVAQLEQLLVNTMRVSQEQLLTEEAARATAAGITILEGERYMGALERTARAASASITVLEGESYQDALERVVTGGRRLAIGYVSTYSINGVNYTHDHVAINPPGNEVIIDAIANPLTTEPRPATTEPRPASPAAPPRSSPRLVQSSLPGLNSSVLEHLDDGLSTTERFLLWNGHTGPGKPP
jgi:hypothetical protein